MHIGRGGVWGCSLNIGQLFFPQKKDEIRNRKDRRGKIVRSRESVGNIGFKS